MYIASQTLVILGLVISNIGTLLKKKSYLLTCTIIASVLFVTSYILLLSPLPALVNSITLIRDLNFFYFDNKNKPKKIYICNVVFAILATSACAIIGWSGPLDIILIVAVIFSSVGYSQKNMLLLRSLCCLNCMCWFVYNLSLGAYGSMFCDTFTFVVTLVGIVIYSIIPYIKSCKKNKEVIIESKEN